MSQRVKIERPKLLNKKGFYVALEILDRYYSSNRAQYPLWLKTFFLGLKAEGSYYNAFTRVKKIMIKRKLVEIYRDEWSKKQVIILTKKGQRLVLQLKSIFNLLNGAEE